MKSFWHFSVSDVFRMLYRHYISYNQPCSCGHREEVVGVVTLDKPTRQCGRSSCESIGEIGFSLSLCWNSFCVYYD